MPFQDVQQPRFIFNLMEYAKLSGAIKSINVEATNENLSGDFYRVIGGKNIPLFNASDTSVEYGSFISLKNPDCSIPF